MKLKTTQIKESLRHAYRLLPLKRPLIYALRSLGVGRLLPNAAKEFLVFEAPFSIQLVEEKSSFEINNGYGRQIEALCFWDGVQAFEPSTIKLWRQLALDANVIVDIGANTGIYSFVAKSVNPQSDVYSFEPIDRIYQILKKNVSLNSHRWQPTREIHAFNVALSDYDGYGEMFDLPVEHMYTASLNKDIHAARGNPMASVTESVKVQRLDTFCETHALIPDLIKIDVESHEPAVLRGMGDLLKKYQPTIICEIWDNSVGEAVEASLKGRGYNFIAIGDTLTKMKHVCNHEPNKGYINYLFAPDDLLSRLPVR